MVHSVVVCAAGLCAQEYQRLVDIVPLSKFEADERQSAINKLAADYSKHCCAVVKRLVQARGSGGALKVSRGGGHPAPCALLPLITVTVGMVICHR